MHADPTDSDRDANPEHWYIYIIFYKDKKPYRSHKTVEIKVFS
jgi:hypothetical protein